MLCVNVANFLVAGKETTVLTSGKSNMFVSRLHAARVLFNELNAKDADMEKACDVTTKVLESRRSIWLGALDRV